MPARVARPARKIFLKRPLDLGRFHRKNLYNIDRSTSGRLQGKNYLLQPMVASGSGYCG